MATFGYTTLGSSKLGPSKDKLFGTRFTSPSDIGQITSVSHAICNDLNSDRTFKVVIVLQSTGVIVTNGVSTATTMPYSAAQTPSWATASFTTPPTLATNTAYILYVIHSDNDWANYSAYDAGTANYYYFDSSNSYTTPTNPTDAVTTGDDNGGGNNAKLSIYVTYTPVSSTSVKDLIGGGFIPFKR